MPLTNKQKQQVLRDKRAKVGLKRKEYWLKDNEKVELDKRLRQLRKGN